MGANTPITEQRACFKAAFSKLVRTSNHSGKPGNGLKQPLHTNWVIMSAKTLTGVLLQGISRRPILDEGTWTHVGKNIIEITNVHGNIIPTTTINYTFTLRLKRWISCHIQQTWQQIDSHNRKRLSQDQPNTPANLTACTSTTHQPTDRLPRTPPTTSHSDSNGKDLATSATLPLHPKSGQQTPIPPSGKTYLLAAPSANGVMVSVAAPDVRGDQLPATTWAPGRQSPARATMARHVPTALFPPSATNVTNSITFTISPMPNAKTQAAPPSRATPSTLPTSQRTQSNYSTTLAPSPHAND